MYILAYGSVGVGVLLCLCNSKSISLIRLSVSPMYTIHPIEINNQSLPFRNILYSAKNVECMNDRLIKLWLFIAGNQECIFLLPPIFGPYIE